jgi:hypothetical protein
MDEIYSKNNKITPKPFFVSALITEGVAVIVLIAVLLSIRFITPKFFKKIRTFYTENICFNAASYEGKVNDEL